MSKQEDPRALFGRHLKTLRMRRNWSQETLALESKLARSYLGGVERGQRNIALLNICVLADTLGVSPSEMLNFAEEVAQIEPTKKTERSRPAKVSVGGRRPKT